MAEVILTDVVKDFPGGVRAVDRVNLNIADEEFLVLVGPSGCGKSTTLRMVAGLEGITAGKIEIAGRTVNDVAPKDRDIAMVFQNYALYPHMTVYNNMAFGLRMRRRSRGLINALLQTSERRKENTEIDRRVREAARMLGITPLLARKPKALSGGQRQRVAVGRAIVREPKAFLFDEPLSNLDAKLRIEMRAEIKRLHRKVQTTTIYVTHDQEEAMTLGDRVCVMKDGLIQQLGSPFDVYERPSNKFVAGFVGTPPMNFITGRVTPNRAFTDGNVSIPLTDERWRKLESHVEQPVVLGLRPDVLLPPGTEVPTPAAIRARVDVVEPLGDRLDAHLSTPHGLTLIARMDARTRLTETEEYDFPVDVTRSHFFEDHETGPNLVLQGG